MTNYSRSVLKSNGLRRPKSGLKSLTFRPNPFLRISPKSYRCNAVPNHFSSRFSTSCTNGPYLLSRVKVGTHSALGEKSHTSAYTPKQGAFRTGVVSLPSDHSARFGNPARPGIRTANFAAFRSWPGRCSQRTQKAFGAAMRLCASLFRRRRGPAGLRNLFLLLSELWLVHPCAQNSLRV